MPVKLQAPVVVPVPPTHVQSAGKQEDFIEAGVSLAAALGWDGPPDHIGNGIAVVDAQAFIVRVLHEHYIAGAKGEPQPDYRAACEHLAVDDAKEQAAIDAALSQVYEAGKGAPLTAHPIVKADLGQVNLQLNISRAEELAAGKAG
jgi:hypothetical protein